MKPRKETPKSRILHTADRLFYTQGYRATGINQIIREARVAKASFYAHFATKESLALAYLQARHARWSRDFLHRVQRSQRPVLQLLGAFDFLLDWLPGVQFRGCAFANLSAEFPVNGEVRRAIVAHKHWVQQQFVQILSSASHLSPNTQEQTASMAFLLFEGAIVQAEITRTPAPLYAARAAAEQLAKTLDSRS